MVVQERIRVPIETFEQFINLPENADRLFEYIGGEIVEVPSNPYSSKIAMLIVGALLNYLQQNDIGHVTGEAGGYRISGERYTPDAAFISYTRQPELPYHEQYNPNPPELAVEVLSPSDTDDRLRIKIGNYLAAGTVLWLVNPETKEVEVYAPGQPVKVIGESGTLDGGDVLPGFTLAVQALFGR